jgi:hypothetical protein
MHSLMFYTKYYKVFVHENVVLSALIPDKSTKLAYMPPYWFCVRCMLAQAQKNCLPVLCGYL